MQIDKKSNKPIYLQIYDNVVDEIKNGYLIPFEKLISRRKLSIQLDISPQTVENAYQKLISDGYVFSKQGSGYFVDRKSVV